jgi:hypothetical protein
MRVAISGSHLVGKTSLAEALADLLPGYDLVPEPYRLLEEDGHAFAETPSIEDFELQLERSCRCVLETGANVIFDRCPLDIVGYLITHRDADAFQLDDWMPRIREAIGRLDLIAFVPIETPDRMAVPRPQASLRAEVDAVLRDIVADDAYGLEVEVITMSGTLADRVRQVAAHLRSDGT